MDVPCMMKSKILEQMPQTLPNLMHITVNEMLSG